MKWDRIDSWDQIRNKLELGGSGLLDMAGNTELQSSSSRHAGAVVATMAQSSTHRRDSDRGGELAAMMPAGVHNDSRLS